MHTKEELAAGNVPALEPLRQALQLDETSVPDGTQVTSHVGTQLFNYICAFRLFDVLALIEDKAGLQAPPVHRNQACKGTVDTGKGWKCLSNWPKLLVDFKEKMDATNTTPAPHAHETGGGHQLKSLCRLILQENNLEVRFNVQLAAMQLTKIVVDSQEVSFQQHPL